MPDTELADTEVKSTTAGDAHPDISIGNAWKPRIKRIAGVMGIQGEPLFAIGVG